MMPSMAAILILFLSTLSLRRATVFLLRKITITVDISIHALLAESDYTDLDSSYGALISIHALLAESDRFQSFRQSG